MNESQDSNVLPFPRIASRKTIAHGKELIRCKWLHILFLRVQLERLRQRALEPSPDAPTNPPAS